MEATAPRMPWWGLSAMTGRRHGRGSGHGSGHGPGHGRPGPGWGMGGGPPWLRGGGFPAFGAQRGRRGRGDVRLVVLGLLAEEPMHGYQLLREVARRSRGTWRLSPGSVYPTLSALEEEGLVVADDGGGRRSYRLTDAGRAELAEHADEYAALWDESEDLSPHGWHDLAGLVAQVGAAAVQVGSEGTEQQRERAAELLEDARRSLYRLLADDEPREET